MPLTDNFDGSFGSGMSLTVVTAAGAGTTVPIHGIEGLKPPDRTHKKDTYTPISGTRAGHEQMVLCSESSATITGTLTYELAHQSAMDDICGVNGCAITLTYADGSILSGTGGIETLGIARVEDSRHMTSDITIALNAGWTVAASGTDTSVPAYNVTLSAGAATIDLTACGSAGASDLDGYILTELTLTSAATNTEDVTIAVGASHGYDIGGSFSITLSPGQTVVVYGTATSDTVEDGVTDTLDLSSTDLDAVVTVTIKAELDA